MESTDELGTDLGDVIQLQRRLSGLERDLAAIQAKLDSLNKEADRISDEKPEEAAQIRNKITQITELWQELKMMVCSTLGFEEGVVLVVIYGYQMYCLHCCVSIIILIFFNG